MVYVDEQRLNDMEQLQIESDEHVSHMDSLTDALTRHRQLLAQTGGSKVLLTVLQEERAALLADVAKQESLRCQLDAMRRQNRKELLETSLTLTNHYRSVKEAASNRVTELAEGSWTANSGKETQTSDAKAQEVGGTGDHQASASRLPEREKEQPLSALLRLRDKLKLATDSTALASLKGDKILTHAIRTAQSVLTASLATLGADPLTSFSKGKGKGKKSAQDAPSIKRLVESGLQLRKEMRRLQCAGLARALEHALDAQVCTHECSWRALIADELSQRE